MLSRLCRATRGREPNLTSTRSWVMAEPSALDTGRAHDARRPLRLSVRPDEAVPVARGGAGERRAAGELLPGAARRGSRARRPRSSEPGRVGRRSPPLRRRATASCAREVADALDRIARGRRLGCYIGRAEGARRSPTPSTRRSRPGAIRGCWRACCWASRTSCTKGVETHLPKIQGFGRPWPRDGALRLRGPCRSASSTWTSSQARRTRTAPACGRTGRARAGRVGSRPCRLAVRRRDGTDTKGRSASRPRCAASSASS
jgi:hypothetical protein